MNQQRYLEVFLYASTKQFSLLIGTMIKTKTYNSFSDSLVQAREYLSDNLEEVNKLILSKLSQKVPLVNGMAGYLIQAGGKRLRPILLLLIARLFSYQGMRHIKLAAAIEFIHTATLLHDDVVDRSAQRRGRPSANAIWGDSSCILVGDFLFSRAFEFVTDDGSLEIMEILSRMTTSVAEGEIMQLGAVGNLQLEEKQYFQIIESKTAYFFEACCQIGALISNISEREIEQVREYGHNFGMAFQILDDLLDYDLNQVDALGKDAGRDLQEKSVTLPMIVLLQKATLTEQEEIKKIFQSGKYEAQHLEYVQKLMRRYNVERLVLSYAIPFINRALATLENLPACQEKEFLQGFISFTSSRKF